MEPRPRLHRQGPNYHPGWPRAPAPLSPRGRTTHESVTFVQDADAVEDADAHYERAKAAGAEIVRKIETRPTCTDHRGVRRG